MEKHWLVRPENIRLLWRAFIGILALTVAAELFVQHHAYFGIDGYFAFNAWFGFLACAALILFAKGLGAFLKRPDDYYDGRDD
ncbi:MAG: hypothetical protein IH605_11595 [Burkholderiales bacterium]|nr:hypothetical protein [Burkholderiales bacterium]